MKVRVENRFVVFVQTAREVPEAAAFLPEVREIVAEQIHALMNVQGVTHVEHTGASEQYGYHSIGWGL